MLQDKAWSIAVLIFSEFASSVGDISGIATSSAYPKEFLRPSSLKRGDIYSINRIGDTGEPWGSPQLIALGSPTSLSMRMQTLRSVANDPIQLQR